MQIIPSDMGEAELIALELLQPPYLRKQLQ